MSRLQAVAVGTEDAEVLEAVVGSVHRRFLLHAIEDS